MSAPLRILLGPQNPERNIASVVASAELPDGPLAVVSAGWQEAEGDLAELQELVGRPLLDLGLYRRAEAVMQSDAELAAAHRQRQDELKERQRLYRLRLRSLALAARRLQRIDGDSDTLIAERRHAIKQLRALDRHHLKQCEARHRDFEQAVSLVERASIRDQAEQIRDVIAGTAAVIVTGGNVGILVNRLRLFGLAPLLADRPIIAWSAGAMAISRRVVLFHDRMPQGRRDAELFGYGLNLVPGVVAMPDAKHRLRTDTPKRNALMARRFSPDTCLTLNNGSVVVWRGDRIVEVGGARRIGRNGRLGRLRAA